MVFLRSPKYVGQCALAMNCDLQLKTQGQDPSSTTTAGVYFATHGLVANDLQGLAKAKAEPALVFTIPEQPSDLNDGLLQASEIAELKLNAQADMARTC